jgi:pimeloyl-ACP methyl ester carboxylesterase
MSSLQWEEQIQHFKNRYRCIVVNLPGFNDHNKGTVMPTYGYDATALADLLAQTIEEVCQLARIWIFRDGYLTARCLVQGFDFAYCHMICDGIFR